MDFAELAGLTSEDAEHPPPAPVPVDWPAVEEWLGLPLPADYKRLAEAWGTAQFGGRLTVRTPYHQAEDGQDRDRFDYGDWLRETHREARIEARTLAEPARPAVHPAPGGLLAWGTDRSDTLFWDTSASPDPDRWTVVVLRPRQCDRCSGDRWEAYDLTLTEYLTEACTRPLNALPATLGRRWDAEHPLPWTPPPHTAPRLTGERRDFALDSGTGLAALTVLTPPPRTPYLGDGTWERLFGELGTRLPTEYVTLMDRYGAGCWGDWLRFHTPLRGDGGFRRHAEQDAEAYRGARGSWRARDPYPLWPEHGSLLTFATSLDNDKLGWLTEGPDPEAWPLVVWPRHAPQGPVLPYGLVDTLLAWRRGRFGTEGLLGLDQDDDPVAYALFEPWDATAHW
ncbi:hypothetical protein [Streptomyces sp. AP-93]|uniref:hypothetical protein n=1 Tax=Streptomyces sp. AP-93 TaxID=2929048 RepID=UPI001FAF2931|nr:hypothetical protein [Streptomyces sp. AP-93]MCJ0872946.1 hypothetical protein [Streptomyces sp. AP-93]